uniref:Genome polyprotein n=1 Tax=Caliciviridae sp. TaxID=1916234 RepID=A0A6M9Z6R5_9CALI|nr:MAG: polyprotein [Caliciviridae sp.]
MKARVFLSGHSDFGQKILAESIGSDYSHDETPDPVLTNAFTAFASTQPPSDDFIKQVVNSTKNFPSGVVLGSLTSAKTKAMMGDTDLTEISTALIAHTHKVLSGNQNFLERDVKRAMEQLSAKPRKLTLKSVFVEFLNNLAEKFKEHKWFQMLNSFLTGFHFGMDVLGDVATFCDWLLLKMKPAALTAILITYNGTQSSLFAVIVAVLQLYDLFDPTIITEIVTHLGDMLWDLVVRGRNFLFGRQEGTLQAPDSYMTLVTTLFAGALIASVGNLPPRVASKVRSLLIGATTITAVLKCVTTIQNLIMNWFVRRNVVDLCESTAALGTLLTTPSVFSVAEKLRELSKKHKALEDSVVMALSDPAYNTHVATLRSIQTSLQMLGNRINILLAGSTDRKPPTLWVFCGPPGIGKTALVNYIASQINPGRPHSVFSTLVDHHDGYTGEKVCVWDEIDSDPNANFVEAVVAMVNSNPYLLNCDLAENKGKIFTSQVVLATTNSPTMVQPNCIRAHAFYRRTNIIDVSAPSIEKFIRDNPGAPVPVSLFKSDFSHLQLRLRGFLVYTPEGHVLNSDKISPSVPIQLSKLISKLKENGQLQAGPEQKIVRFVTTNVEGWHVWFKNRLRNFPVQVLKEGEHFTSHSNVLLVTSVSCGIGNFIVKTSDGCDIPQNLFLLNDLEVEPKLPSDVNECLFTEVFGSKFLVQKNLEPFMSPTNVYKVLCPADVISVLKKEYGLIACTRWGLSAMKLILTFDFDEFFQKLSQNPFPPEQKCFVVQTPFHNYVVYTSTGAVIVSSKSVNTVGMKKPVIFDYSLSFGDKVVNIVVNLWKFFMSKFAHLASATAVSVFLHQRQCAPQSGPDLMRRYRGMALTDDQYEDWQKVRRVLNTDFTAEEFLAAHKSFEAQTAALSSRVLAIANWLKTNGKITDASGGVLQSPPSNDPVEPIYRSDGSLGGWATYIGHSRWLANKHTYKPGCEIKGKQIFPIPHPINNADVQVYVGPEHNVVATLSKGPPVRTWDNRPVTFAREHKAVMQGQDVEGWVAMVIGGTNLGDCGRPYFCARNQVCGIHTGYYEASCQVMISSVNHTEPVQAATWRDIPVKNSGICLGALPKGTQFGRSVAHPTKYEWETYEPAPYGKNDPRCLPTQERILAQQLMPYTMKNTRVSDNLSVAAQHIKSYFSDMLKFMPKVKLLSLDSAINRLDLTTSCGPFVPGVKGNYVSRSKMGDGVIYDRCSLFGLHISNMMAAASAGQPIEHGYKLGLKDELLPYPKFQQKKRLLWCCDVGVVTLANMVMGDLMEKLKNLVPVSPIAVGSNVHSTLAALWVKKFMNKMTLCVDYKKWDSTMNKHVIHHALDILKHLCPEGPYTEACFRTLMQNPRGYFMDKVVEAERGLPSGMPFTSVINSMCHLLYYICAIWDTEDNAGVARTVSPLNEHPLIVYGDDGVYSFDYRFTPHLQDFLNCLRSYGLQPTSATKQGDIIVGGKEVFLKRTFEPTEEGLVVMPLQLESILRQFVWVKGSQTENHLCVKQPCENRKDQIQECLLELILHGRDKFYEWLPLAQETIEKEGLTCIETDYEVLKQVYRSRYLSGDFSCNEILLEGYRNSEFDGGVLQNGPEKEQRQNTQEQQQQQMVPVNATTEPGMITGSYTATPNVIGTAGAAEPESLPLATMGAGTQSGVPQELYGLWVSCIRFSWNVQQPVGTRLGTFYLSPELHPHLQLLSRMYAGWSGDMGIRIMISAPGVVGGRLIAAVLPPGVRPENVRNPTAYPCGIFDARLMNPLQMVLPDIRQNTFHGTDSLDVTSSISIYVNTPLVNPFSGSDTHLTSVDVTVYACPMPNFTFCLLVEPRTEQSTYSNLLPISSDLLFSNRTGEKVTALQKVVQFRQSWNHFNFESITTGWGDGNPNGVFLITAQSRVNYTNPANTVFSGITATPGRPNVGGFALCPTIPDYCFHGQASNTTGSTWVTNTTYNNIVGSYNFYAIVNSGDTNSVDLAEATSGDVGPMLMGTFSSTTNAANFSGTVEINTSTLPWAFVQRNVTNNSIFIGTTLGVLNGSANSGSDPIVTAGTPYAVATSGNQMCTFVSNVLGSAGTSGINMRSSQPLALVERLMQTAQPFPNSSMLVYRFQSPTDSFEIGIRNDGYVMIGGADLSTVSLRNTEYTISYSGMASISTPLVAPRPIVGNRSVDLLEFTPLDPDVYTHNAGGDHEIDTRLSLMGIGRRGSPEQ